MALSLLQDSFGLRKSVFQVIDRLTRWEKEGAGAVPSAVCTGCFLLYYKQGKKASIFRIIML